MGRAPPSAGLRMVSDTPIYDQLVRELYAARAREAYAKSPDMIGCGQWELPPSLTPPPGMRKRPPRKRVAT